MNIKASVFIATSLDGFIAREDGSIDWLNEANTLIPSGEDCGYGAFIQPIDVIVMGRKTFELVLTFDPWPYGDKKMVVLSSQPLNIPARLQNTVSASSKSPQALVEQLAAEGAQNLYVDGGVTIQRFLSAGLIDEIIITLIPVLLGKGIPLFGPIPNDISLVHLETKTFEFGFVQVKYQVAHQA